MHEAWCKAGGSALRALVLTLALLTATPAHADPVERWRAYIDEASARFGIQAAWIERVMRAESAGLTTLNGQRITSRAGAMGLMQLMPGTWTQMRAALGLGSDPHDPRDNILAGTFYLRLMYDRFGYPGLFAAYNAGPARYAASLATGRTLPGETRAYLASVAGMSGKRDAIAEAAPPNPIFFAIRSAPSPAVGHRTGSAAIFVPLSARSTFAEEEAHSSESSPPIAPIPSIYH